MKFCPKCNHWLQKNEDVWVCNQCDESFERRELMSKNKWELVENQEESGEKISKEDLELGKYYS